MTIGHLQLTPSKRRLQFPSNLWLTILWGLTTLLKFNKIGYKLWGQTP